MANEQDLKLAKTIYNQICDVMDARGWKYNKHEENNVVHFTVVGEDIPMEFIAFVDVERQIVSLMSQLPFKFAADKRLEGAIVTSSANYAIADGCFQYDITDGEIGFKITSSYRNSLISNETIDYMIGCSSSVVDEFNDKFLMVSKGVMSVEDFLRKY